METESLKGYRTGIADGDEGWLLGMARGIRKGEPERGPAPVLFFDPAGANGPRVSAARRVLGSRAAGFTAAPVHFLPGGFKSAGALLEGRWAPVRKTRDPARPMPWELCPAGVDPFAWRLLLERTAGDASELGRICRDPDSAGDALLRVFMDRLAGGGAVTGMFWLEGGLVRGRLASGGPGISAAADLSGPLSGLVSALSPRKTLATTFRTAGGGLSVAFRNCWPFTRSPSRPIWIPVDAFGLFRVKEAPVIVNTAILVRLIGYPEDSGSVLPAALWMLDGKLRAAMGEGMPGLLEESFPAKPAGKTRPGLRAGADGVGGRVGVGGGRTGVTGTGAGSGTACAGRRRSGSGKAGSGRKRSGSGQAGSGC
ncbi:MAG: hypothetical protein LBQ79_06995 [Deltaproteobacteria bacterium]|jgi:hypothetical protein|nr:hypothetical protein [Deltaproteobacteria bacterium]